MSYVKQTLGVLRVNKSRIKNFHGYKKKKRKDTIAEQQVFAWEDSMCVWSRMLLVQSPPNDII